MQGARAPVFEIELQGILQTEMSQITNYKKSVGILCLRANSIRELNQLKIVGIVSETYFMR
jgi:hypothetical protein